MTEIKRKTRFYFFSLGDEPDGMVSTSSVNGEELEKGIVLTMSVGSRHMF